MTGRKNNNWYDCKNPRKIPLDNFTYLIEKSDKIIGIVIESPKKYAVIFKPNVLKSQKSKKMGRKRGSHSPNPPSKIYNAKAKQKHSRKS